MLIQESHHDVPTTADGQGSMRMYISVVLDRTPTPPNPPQSQRYTRDCVAYADYLAGIYVFHPTVPGYPNARCPGVVVFSEIYQGGSPWLNYLAVSE